MFATLVLQASFSSTLTNKWNSENRQSLLGFQFRFVCNAVHCTLYLDHPDSGQYVSAAAVRVRHIEVVALLDSPTCLTHDLCGISLDSVDSPFYLEIMLN